MTKYFCDKCKSESNNLTNIDIHPKGNVFEYMNHNGMLQGTMVSFELCPPCLQEFNWIASAYIRHEITGKNPFQE